MSPSDVAISRQGEVTLRGPGCPAPRGVVGRSVGGARRRRARRLVAVVVCRAGGAQVALDRRLLGLLGRPSNSRRTPGDEPSPLGGLRPRAVNPARTASWRLARTRCGCSAGGRGTGRRRGWARCEDCLGREVILVGSEGDEESKGGGQGPGDRVAAGTGHGLCPRLRPVVSAAAVGAPSWPAPPRRPRTGCHRCKGDTGRRRPEHPGSVGHLWGVLPVTQVGCR